MRLIGVSVENYESITSRQELTGLKTANALIGPNNEGKSTFLEAIIMGQHVLSGLRANSGEAQPYILERLPGKSGENVLEIDLNFELEKRDTDQVSSALPEDTALSYKLRWGGQRPSRRLRILEFLQQGEKSVGEIVKHFDLPQNHVSMHLGCLRWCGYVTTRREGRYVFYSLVDLKVTEIIRLARELLRGSEVYLMTCDVIEKTDENLANVTPSRNIPVEAE